MMKPTLDQLIEAARKHRMTPAEEAEQRRSFVYGNCAIENERVTREMVEEAERKLTKENGDGIN